MNHGPPVSSAEQALRLFATFSELKGIRMRLGRAIGQFLSGYFATRDRSEKTEKAYACDLEQFGRFAGDDRTLEALDPELIEAWAAELKRREYAPASIQRKMVSLRVFCHYWLRKGLLDASPFWRVKLSFGRIQQLPRTLTEDEILKLMEEARRSYEDLRAESDRGNGHVTPTFLALRNYAVIDLLFATGIRVGEAAALTLESFIEDGTTLKVRGKGRRPRLAFLVAPSSVDLQATYREARQAIPVDTRALFLNAFGNPLSTQGMANVLTKLRHRAKLDRHVTPHMIRHTIATLLLRNGADIRVVQEFLGHASIATTQRYTHITKQHLVGVLGVSHPMAR
jgi:integrase/recombinase XerD